MRIMRRVVPSWYKQPPDPDSLVQKIAARRWESGVMFLAVLAMCLTAIAGIKMSLSSREVLDSGLFLLTVGAALGILFAYLAAHFELGAICRRSLDSLKEGSNPPLEERPFEPLDSRP